MREHYPNNIWLTGFMGAGKSTVGPLVARAIGWDFVDTDPLVEKAAGKTIAELFSEGEPRFREWERQVVRDVASRTGQVVALGGGALLDEESRERVLSSGVLVYLRAGLDGILGRLRPAERPLLKGLEPLALRAKVEAMLAAREPVYRRAHVTVATDGLLPELVAGDVLRKVAAWKK